MRNAWFSCEEKLQILLQASGGLTVIFLAFPGAFLGPCLVFLVI